ncbi:MAG: hypothetical protein AAF479_04400 [Pseudomonadota bacterium]
MTDASDTRADVRGKAGAAEDDPPTEPKPEPKAKREKSNEQATAEQLGDQIVSEGISAIETSNSLRCIQTADLAFNLIAHLAGQGVQVSPETYQKIHVVTQLDPRQGKDMPVGVQHEFWQAYCEIVQKVRDRGEDPEGIYYTAIFERPFGHVFSSNALSNKRWLRLYSLGIAVIALSVLTLLVMTLAYGTAINNMLAALTTLEQELLTLRSGSLVGTRLEALTDNIVSCEVGPGVELPQACRSTIASIEAAIRSELVFLRDFMSLGLANNLAEPDTNRTRSIAQQIYVFMSDYIYPLLAGALGACVSLLRAIFAQLREKRLHVRVFKSAYLRIAVGTIAGIVIGWVGSTDVNTGISLTPLALAFAAGYAVEIIYNVLDRFVIAFSQPIESQFGGGTARRATPSGVNDDANVHKAE